MTQLLKNLLRKLSLTPLGAVLDFGWHSLAHLQLSLSRVVWFFQGAKRPTPAQQALVRENVTFLFKSFERQKAAKRLYRNIQRYYPGVRVIIVDDSRTPLNLSGPNLRVIQLPFNSGLCRGLNRGLACVETPFVIRMDDDELLTPYTGFHQHLEFLFAHPEVDLVGVLPMNLPLRPNWKRQGIAAYLQTNMANAPKPLLIPHGTRIDKEHIVLGKTPNIFLVRTDRFRTVGYDDNIRMIDHHEFFFRAAGNLVSVLAFNSFVAHIQWIYNRAYIAYRSDIIGDKRYIAAKYRAYRKPQNPTPCESVSKETPPQ